MNLSNNDTNIIAVLDEVQDIILNKKFAEERKYPKFEKSMTNVATAATAILHKEITPKDITFIMVLLKLDRESKSPKLDNIKDALAYLSINLKLQDYEY